MDNRISKIAMLSLSAVCISLVGGCIKNVSVSEEEINEELKKQNVNLENVEDENELEKLNTQKYMEMLSKAVELELKKNVKATMSVTEEKELSKNQNINNQIFVDANVNQNKEYLDYNPNALYEEPKSEYVEPKREEIGRSKNGLPTSVKKGNIVATYDEYWNRYTSTGYTFDSVTGAPIEPPTALRAEEETINPATGDIWFVSLNIFNGERTWKKFNPEDPFYKGPPTYDTSASSKATDEWLAKGNHFNIQ